jgi:hypothetical protein
MSGANAPNSAINASASGRLLFIKDLEPNQKSINLHAIVLEIGKPSQTKDGHEVRNIRIADKRSADFHKIQGFYIL